MQTNKTILKRFIASLWQQKMRLSIVLISVICYTFFAIVAPLCSAIVIDLIWDTIKDSMTYGKTFQITWQQGGYQLIILLGLYCASSLFYSLQTLLMASFAEKLNLQLRQTVSEKLQRLPLSYFDKRPAGEIMSRITNDLEEMSEALQTGLLKLFTAIATIIGSLAIMFTYSAMLTIIFLAFMSLSLILTRIVTSKTLHYASHRQKCVAKLNGLVEEAYTGRNIIKAFNYEQMSRKRIHEATEDLATATQKTEFIIYAINPAVRLINRFGQVCIAVLGCFMLFDGRLTPGRFQAFFQYVNQISEPLTELSYMLNSLQSAFASLKRIYAILDEQEMTVDVNKNNLAQVQGNIEFSHVQFSYTLQKILMKDINFTVKAGQKIAIVGTTGAGKTTLVNLLMRFYEINSGKILIDGVDIKTIARAKLRHKFGMVLQDTWLFQGTIAENIAYGKPNATREEIIAAAKAAHADFFICTLPKGYDTLLSSDAENISSGQRQLLTIARVMLANPPMLILDEATSSIDTRTEQEINKAMIKLMHKRTSFIIAHRLSTIVDADLILVMHHGNIIEQGTHFALLKQHGFYAKLYHSQFA